MRTTASRSARSSKRQSMSSGHAGPALPGPEALDGDRVDRRVPAAEPPAEGRSRRVVVDDERRATAAYDAAQLAQPGLAARPEEVRPPCMNDVHRRVGQRQALGAPVQQRHVRQRAGTPAREPQEGRVRLDAVHQGRRGGEPRQVEARAAAEVEHLPRCPVRRWRTSCARGRRRGRPHGSRARTSRGAPRCSGWGSCRAGAAVISRRSLSPSLRSGPCRALSICRPHRRPHRLGRQGVRPGPARSASGTARR